MQYGPKLLIQLHHLTTFSMLQFAQRGCWQLGQASVLIGTGVCPQEHFSQVLESAQPADEEDQGDFLRRSM
jgi:hypothetical protein